MLRFGIVSQINALNAQARVSFQDDESTSYWLPVLQTKTLNDKFYVMPDIGKLVACLMDENSEDGVMLGTIYSTEDVPVTQSEKEISMNLEDGSYINANKESQTHAVAFSTMKLIGNIEHEGTFTNTAGIKSNADITDKTSSMQAMREIYNPHTHKGNQGSPTSAPNKTM